MKTQTTTNPNVTSEKAPIPPALTRALRAAIQADKLQNVFVTAGATKFRGTPFEVLEEVAVSQTAAWIVGFQATPMSGPLPMAGNPEVFDAAAETIDADALRFAAQTVGLNGSNEVEKIRTYLASSLAQTAFETIRFALAEDRPVDHNCVAVGGSHAVRASLQGPLSERLPSGR